MACEEGWLGRLSRNGDGQIFIGAVDSAQGTDATFSTAEGVKDGRGDDGVDVIWELGEGTPEKPHKLCYVHIAEDVRSEPMAYDIQQIEDKFAAEFYMVDPGGGGKAVLEKLAKRKLEKTEMDGHLSQIEVVPMLPWDHEMPRDAKTNICIFSLSNEMITSAYVDSKTHKAMFQYSDQLNNYMVITFQNALKDKTAQLTQQFEVEDLIEAYNENRISDDQLQNLTNIRTAMSQLCHMRYVTDRSGRRKKTSHGVFTYTSTGKKDIAWTVLMGYMMCDIIVRLKKLGEQNAEESGIIPDVE